MTPGSWLSRLAAVGAPLAILAVLYALAIAPLTAAYIDASARIEAAQARIAGYSAAKARLPSLERALEAQTRAASADELFAPASAPETQSALQAQLQKLLASSGVESRMSRVLPPVPRGSFTAFEIEVDFTATPPHLARLFEATETAKPALRIEKLTISVPEGGKGPVDDEGQPNLSVRADIAGLSRAR